MKNIHILGVSSLVGFTLLLGTTVFAASANFSGNLPPNQGDTQVSTVARASSDVKHFTISITKLGSGNAIRAWTEGGLGDNYSDPYNQVPFSGTYNVLYYTNKIPGKGQNTTLNLDNPINTSASVPVGGNWSPN